MHVLNQIHAEKKITRIPCVFIITTNLFYLQYLILYLQLLWFIFKTYFIYTILIFHVRNFTHFLILYILELLYNTECELIYE